MNDSFPSRGCAWDQSDQARRVSRSSGRQQMLLIALILLLVGSGLLTKDIEAAERTQPIKIGALTESWGPTPHVVGLRDGLVELGYRENKDFVIGVRFTQGDFAALPTAARELVQYGVDLIFTSGYAAKAAQMATTQIPIVFSTGADPVEIGLVESFARPGGNITGVVQRSVELGPKRLEIFREIIPGLRRVLYLYDVNHLDGMKMIRDAARRLGIELVEKPVQTEEEAQESLAQIQKKEIDGILATSTPSLNIPGFILKATTQQGIPTMFDAAFWVEQGGLASYGPDYYASGWQAARLVDKILKGADPAEIPVEVNSHIELAINLKTAKALGLTIPPEVLFQADQVIR